MRDQFLDQQYRSASTDMGYWSQIVSSMKKMEGVLTDPAVKKSKQSLGCFLDIHAAG
jgi:hypothetical protein